MLDLGKMDTKEIVNELKNVRKDDDVFRALWAEHVERDVKAVLEEADTATIDVIAGNVALRYVNGDFDCNLSYWDNITNLIREEEKLA